MWCGELTRVAFYVGFSRTLGLVCCGVDRRPSSQRGHRCRYELANPVGIGRRQFITRRSAIKTSPNHKPCPKRFRPTRTSSPHRATLFPTTWPPYSTPSRARRSPAVRRRLKPPRSGPSSSRRSRPPARCRPPIFYPRRTSGRGRRRGRRSRSGSTARTRPPRAATIGGLLDGSVARVRHLHGLLAEWELSTLSAEHSARLLAMIEALETRLSASILQLRMWHDSIPCRPRPRALPVALLGPARPGRLAPSRRTPSSATSSSSSSSAARRTSYPTSRFCQRIRPLAARPTRLAPAPPLAAARPSTHGPTATRVWALARGPPRNRRRARE